MSRPARSDAHLSPEGEAAMEAEVREYYDEAAPKRHSKPSRSEPSAVYTDALVPDDSHPELDRFQQLEAHTEVSNSQLHFHICVRRKIDFLMCYVVVCCCRNWCARMARQGTSSWKRSTTRISAASASSTTRLEQDSSRWTSPRRTPRFICLMTQMQRSAMLLAREILLRTSGFHQLTRCIRHQTSPTEATAEQRSAPHDYQLPDVCIPPANKEATLGYSHRTHLSLSLLFCEEFLVVLTVLYSKNLCFDHRSVFGASSITGNKSSTIVLWSSS